MRDKDPGELVGVFADRLQIAVPDSHVDGEHSYKAVSGTKRDVVTVTLEAEFTHFRFGDEVFVFDGVTYRPEREHYPADESPSDGEVSLKYPADDYRGYPDYGHPLRPETALFRVEMLTDMLLSGDLEPAPRP